ncbi:hypothetical protein FACS1894201_07080 [Bacteroidia bacterium]|nr:hypothetical protein FACS1894201_07080 [Bacteroidia bacterium]
MMGLNTARYVGVYFPFTDKKAFDQTMQFVKTLQNRNISVDCLSYVNGATKPIGIKENSKLNFFTTEQLGFNMTPNGGAAKLFLNQQFDILIDLSMTNHIQNLYIDNASLAAFKIGRLNKEGLTILDFSVDVPDNANVSVLSETILKYLDNFETRHTPKHNGNNVAR